MEASTFVPLVLARVKEIRDAIRTGRAANPQVFEANPKLRKMAVLSEEVDTGVVGAELCSRCNANTPAAIFKLAVQWTIQTDPISVEVRTAQDDERKAAQKDAKDKRAVEREQKKAADAQEKADAAAKAAGM